MPAWFPGRQLPLYYYGSDVVVLVSFEEEGWGITLLEGMVSGKPVIGSPLGALTELVQGRGIVLQENTVEDLAQAIERLIKSPGLREEMGRAGQHLCQAIFLSSRSPGASAFIRRIARPVLKDLIRLGQDEK